MIKNKLSLEEFIKRSRIFHGEKYDYSKSLYVGTNKKLTIICETHGEFMQYPYDHMRGRGCEKCGRKKCSNEEFICKAKIVHGDKFDYSDVNYTTSENKVKIICKIHGEFNQIANSHLAGSGCPKCAGNIVSNSEDFSIKANKIHGNKFDYSKVIYVSSKKKVDIICLKHGIFKQMPNCHLSGQGCPKCAGVGRTTEDYILEASLIHDFKYDYSKTIFEFYNKKIIIICPIHGEFEQKPCIHINGSGCQQCTESKGEKKVASFLKKNNIKFEIQKMFDNCVNPKTGYYLKFDFYLPEHNICIEYDGEWHYYPFRNKHDKEGYKENLESAKERDIVKTNYCFDNNIFLLRIPYFEFKNIEKIISNYLL